MAPEISGHLQLVKELSDAGMRVQIGHTLGSYEDGVAALEHGAHGFTHLFNAMTGLHHTPVLLHCVSENRFELYAMRTFAFDVWEWLEDAALEFK